MKFLDFYPELLKIWQRCGITIKLMQVFIKTAEKSIEIMNFIKFILRNNKFSLMSGCMMALTPNFDNIRKISMKIVNWLCIYIYILYLIFSLFFD